MTPTYDFSGQVALVTGAGAGSDFPGVWDDVVHWNGGGAVGVESMDDWPEGRGDGERGGGGGADVRCVWRV
jgi:hypothetical protein